MLNSKGQQQTDPPQAAPESVSTLPDCFFDRELQKPYRIVEGCCQYAERVEVTEEPASCIHLTLTHLPS